MADTITYFGSPDRSLIEKDFTSPLLSYWKPQVVHIRQRDYDLLCPVLPNLKLRLTAFVDWIILAAAT
jgi:hypothetical protein